MKKHRGLLIQKAPAILSKSLFSKHLTKSLFVIFYKFGAKDAKVDFLDITQILLLGEANIYLKTAVALKFQFFQYQYPKNLYHPL